MCLASFPVILNNKSDCCGIYGGLTKYRVLFWWHCGLDGSTLGTDDRVEGSSRVHWQFLALCLVEVETWASLQLNPRRVRGTFVGQSGVGPALPLKHNHATGPEEQKNSHVALIKVFGMGVGGGWTVWVERLSGWMDGWMDAGGWIFAFAYKVKGFIFFHV